MPEQPSLAGSLARIDRADELIAQLDAALKAFLLAQPYTVEERPDDNPCVKSRRGRASWRARLRITSGRRSTCLPISSYCRPA
jgi:hypothetical protein